MTSLSFLRGVAIALILSVSASVLYFSMITLFSTGFAIRTTISVVTFGYVLYLLSNAGSSFGKLSFISLYIVCASFLLFAWPLTLDHALFSVGFIWLVRTVYYHSNFFYALADLVFSVVCFTAALGAVAQSHSVFLSFWCFFLAQALILPILHYFFSKYINRKNNEVKNTNSDNAEQRFYQAHNNAQNALRKLATNA